MEKDEKEVEVPSNSGKSVKKRTGPSVAPSVPGARSTPVKAVPSTPMPAFVGSTNTTTTPTLAAPPTPPATHAGLPQQVDHFNTPCPLLKTHKKCFHFKGVVSCVSGLPVMTLFYIKCLLLIIFFGNSKFARCSYNL